MWIYEHRQWPNFTWDISVLATRLAGIRHRQGLLLGKMEGLGLEWKQEASLRILSNEVVASPAIEGEKLNPEEVRSSVARHLGLDYAGLIAAGLIAAEPAAAGPEVEGMVEMMLDATRGFSKPLTKSRLFGWHAALFPTGHSGIRRITVGGWRGRDADPMQVVSGPAGREKVHFSAPDAARVEDEMKAFLAWCNGRDNTDPILKAGIAHLWFVTVHPFEDGNGRMARAVGEMALARADGLPDRFYSMSAQIAAVKKDYYNQLEKQQRGAPEITGWLSWFLSCLEAAIVRSEKTLALVLFKARLWEKVNRKPVNKRQRLIINRMLAEDFEGFMNTSKYAKMAKCSPDTALRDIQGLKIRRVFLQNAGGGRNTSYRLTDDINGVS